MRRNITLALTAVVGFSLLATSTMPVDASSVKPVKGIDVIVKKRPGESARATTNEQGIASFGPLTPGQYYLIIPSPSGPGEPTTVDVFVFEVTDDPKKP